MYIRQLPKSLNELFRRNLEKSVQREPLDTTYHLDLRVNDVFYRLHLLVANHSELVPLQAVKLNRDIQKCELITDALMLGALTELVVAQYGVNS